MLDPGYEMYQYNYGHKPFLSLFNWITLVPQSRPFKKKQGNSLDLVAENYTVISNTAIVMNILTFCIICKTEINSGIINIFSQLSFLLINFYGIFPVWDEWASVRLNAGKYSADVGIHNQVLLVGVWLLVYHGHSSWPRYLFYFIYSLGLLLNCIKPFWKG